MSVPQSKQTVVCQGRTPRYGSTGAGYWPPQTASPSAKNHIARLRCWRHAGGQPHLQHATNTRGHNSHSASWQRIAGIWLLNVYSGLMSTVPAAVNWTGRPGSRYEGLPAFGCTTAWADTASWYSYADVRAETACWYSYSDETRVDAASWYS